MVGDNHEPLGGPRSSDNSEPRELRTRDEKRKRLLMEMPPASESREARDCQSQAVYVARNISTTTILRGRRSNTGDIQPQPGEGMIAYTVQVGAETAPGEKKLL